MVGAMDLDAPRGGEAPWAYTSLLRVKNAYEDEGFELVRSGKPTAAGQGEVRLARARRRDRQTVCELISNMGKVGIEVWCYEWMPVINWTAHLDHDPVARRRSSSPDTTTARCSTRR